MNTCSTCRHWQFDSTRYNTIVMPYKPNDSWEQCETEEEAVAQRGYRVRYCKAPGVVFYQQPAVNGAALCDGSEYKAYLITGEQFGCVLHESGQPEPK